MEIKTLIFSALFVCYLSASAQEQDYMLNKSPIVESENLDTNNRISLSIINPSIANLNSEEISPEVKIIAIEKSPNNFKKRDKKANLSYTLTPSIIEKNTPENKEAHRSNEMQTKVKRVSATILTVERIEN
jgi:hypothetical protein